MRLKIVIILLLGWLALPGWVHARIYQHNSPDGTVRFSNSPTDERARLSVQIKKTIEFLTYDDQRIQLDIYHPETAKAPIAVLIHGAAGIEGDRAERYERFATDLASRGIIAVNVHYFDSPRSYWGRTIVETIHYADHIENADADRIALIGYSLGGSLALSASLESSRVKVLVINAGALPDGFSPQDVKRLPDDIYMSCGTKDFCYSSLQRLEQMIRGTGKNFTKHAREGEGHSIPDNIFWQQWYEIVDFVSSRLK